ncbi:MAG: NF038130 family PEP-CTERM protein, partial [Pseudanabaena sp. ELA748]
FHCQHCVSFVTVLNLELLAIASSITGATIGGTAPTDYYVYGVSGSNTVKIDPTPADVQPVLDGNAGSPTGNVELRARSEQGGFDFTLNTSLSGAIGGKSITLSSLTASDWTTVGTTWFNAALTANGYGAVIGNVPIYTAAWTKFVSGNGRQRFSDPNISYVNQNEVDGVVSIGLAGHLDATNLLFASLSTSEKLLLDSLRDPSKANTPIQASEIVKYTYEGQTGYLYSFYATNSGLVASDDGVSHTGNYEVTFQGTRPVPVPAGFVGIALAGVIGGGMMKRRKLASKA